MLTAFLALVGTSKIPQEFYRYLNAPDASYAAKVVSQDGQGMTVQMTSQTWRGIPWRHTILIRRPAKLSVRGTGVLYITGDGPFKGDYRDLDLMANATGMPIAMLFSIPNQPLFGGLREDDLIAHTFEQYLKTQEPDWPLLFPMAKSAIRAMDAIQEATKASSNPIRRFVVTGASKRGWTTWFVGAAKDRRVIGIAPMVFDNLNVSAQMPHQLESWGQYSDMIKDYTRRGLQQQLETPAGRHLAALIDPYSYRANIRVPTLIVRGANDPYWTADATNLYWNDLHQPHWLLTVPNAGHDLAGGIMAAISIGAFARAVSGEFRMPHPSGGVEVSGGQVHWSAHIPSNDRDAKISEVGVWVATSDTLDFRASTYRRMGVVAATEGGDLQGGFPRPSGNLAMFLECRYRANGLGFSLSLPTTIVKGQPAELGSGR